MNVNRKRDYDWSKVEVPTPKAKKTSEEKPSKKIKKQKKEGPVYDSDAEQEKWLASQWRVAEESEENVRPRCPYPNDTEKYDHDITCFCDTLTLAKRIYCKKGNHAGIAFYTCSVPDEKNDALCGPMGNVVGGYQTSPLNCGFFQWDTNEPVCKDPQIKPKGYTPISVTWEEIGSREKFVVDKKRPRQEETEDPNPARKIAKNVHSEGETLDISKMFRLYDEKMEELEKMITKRLEKHIVSCNGQFEEQKQAEKLKNQRFNERLTQIEKNLHMEDHDAPKEDEIYVPRLSEESCDSDSEILTF